MAETLTPLLPLSITSYRVVRLGLDWPAQHITVVVLDNQGELTKHAYVGDLAVTLMTQLNTANLSTSSLHKRILERLAADGKLPAGDVTGVPE